MNEETIIVWFHQELRVQDYAPLYWAARKGRVLPVFILPAEERWRLAGTASGWWLHESLKELSQALDKLGSPLILRQGMPGRVLAELAAESGAREIYTSWSYEPDSLQQSKQLTQRLRSKQLEVVWFHDRLLFEPGTIFNGAGEPYRVFTAFHRRLSQEQVYPPLPPPPALAPSPFQGNSLSLEELGLLKGPNWYGKLAAHWQPGERGALQQLEEFAGEHAMGYAEGRDYPDSGCTSRLSPYLAWGNVSVRRVWHVLREAGESASSGIDGFGGVGGCDADTGAFLRQLVWREFAYDQLVHFPHMVDTPMRKPFAAFPWADDPQALARWKAGQTGYPLVDAGMRQLWETGVMHNRVRMVAASFLVKHLLIPWTEGASWFRQTLVDADTANNAMGWQWVTGSGFDAAPYFRIFNPAAQGRRFDPEGSYIRRWVPELRRLPDALIHEPWKAAPGVLDQCGLAPDSPYRKPVVDHAFARERALEAYRIMNTQ